jgi:Na+-driven multidrug efflux pump
MSQGRGYSIGRSVGLEAKELVRLALPLLAAQLLSTSVAAVDTIMSGHYNSV